MSERELKRQLKAALQTPEIAIHTEHLAQTKAAVQDELRRKAGRERIAFGAFLFLQIRFVGWRIWLTQALLLAAVSGLLAASLGEYYLTSPRYVAQLLCCLSVLVLMTALPFLHRALRYKMHEIESATRFSSVRLLLAKLLILGIGDMTMLCGIFCFAVWQTPLPLGSALLYLIFPFLLAGSGLLYLLGHVPAARFTRGSIGLCALLLAAFALLGGLHPSFYQQTLSLSWIAVCAALLVFCVLQFRQIACCAAYAEMQLI